MNIRKSTVLRSVATAVALAAGSSTAYAADVYLQAAAFVKQLPSSSGSVQVPMWGYRLCTDGFSAAQCSHLEGGVSVPNSVTSPGPQITVPAGDAMLVVHLNNTLPDPTSVYIPGQPKGLSPTRTGGRINSFDAVTAPGATVLYTWTNLRSGSYLYQSGTHVQLQVQMGLYGALVHDVNCGSLKCAYTGVPYERAQTLVFSEIDPALHSPTPKAVNATVDGYAPRYFLINGEVFSTAATNPLQSIVTPAPAPGTWVLLRLLNAGLQSHAPELLGGYFQLLAEDGNAAPTNRLQYNALLPAAKSLDVLFTPETSGSFTMFDRRLGLVNDDVSGGGMRAKLDVAGSAVTRLPAPTARSYPGTEDTVLNIAAPGLLATTGGDTAIVASGAKKGSVTVNLNGSFVYTPKANSNGVDTFSYRIANAGVVSLPATVTLNIAPVNDAPVANPDVFFVNNTSGNYVAAAPGVLANDTDVDGDTLSAALVTGTNMVTVAANGAVTYTSGNVGDVAFTYRATDNGTPARSSAAATVHLVRDVRITTATVSGGRNGGRWSFSGQIRSFGNVSSATRTVAMSFTPSGTCAVAGTTYSLGNVTANTNSNATNFNLQTSQVSSGNRSGCSAGVVHAAVPAQAATGAAPAYPAHTVDIAVVIQ